MNLLFVLFLALAAILPGCGDAVVPVEETSLGDGPVLPSLGIGNSDTNVSFYLQSAPDLSPAPLTDGKSLSVSDSFLEELSVEIKGLRVVDEAGQVRAIPVNGVFDLADPAYAGTKHFMTQDGLPAGRYKRIELEIGRVEYTAKIISQDARANLESLQGSVIPVTTPITLRAGEEVGLPLVVNLRDLASDPKSIRAGIPFATLIAVLEVRKGLFVWTTGDLFGLSDEQGELYEYRRDFVLGMPIGRYIPVSDVQGAYLITAGEHKGVQGAYKIVRGGEFAGDRRGVFRLNGALTGGIWISTVPEVGTFALDRGAVPNGTGVFYRLTGELLGTFNINGDVTGGTWVFADGSGSGTLSYNPE